MTTDIIDILHVNINKFTSGGSIGAYTNDGFIFTNTSTVTDFS